MAARLVVSLSGIAAGTLRHCAELAGELDHRGVSLSLLFAPRIGGAEQPSAVVDWVRQRRVLGDALLLHGVNHSGEHGPWSRPMSFLPGRRAEFAALPAHEAGLRLIAAGRALERIGLRANCFAPPRWLASAGTLTALREHGFLLCADLAAVRDLRTGTVHKGRVQGFGHHEAAQPWWCFAMVVGAARVARRGGLVRLAADAAELGKPGPRQALLDAVDVAIHHGAQPTTYRRFVAEPAPPEGRPFDGHRRPDQTSVGSRSTSG